MHNDAMMNSLRSKQTHHGQNISVLFGFVMTCVVMLLMLYWRQGSLVLPISIPPPKKGLQQLINKTAIVSWKRDKPTHINFLKVHKTASTTTQNLFMRFGYTRNLTFVLPPEYNVFGFPNIISINESLNSRNVVPLERNKTFDILCHHVLYSKSAFSKYLHKDSVNIGILRQPYSHFRSVVNYLRPSYIINIDSEDKIGTFLRNPMIYEPPDVLWSYTNNRLSVEYGCPPNIITDRDMDAFKTYLKILSSEFLLVIIAERYDESLVLIKRYFNWSFKDILYIKHNVTPVTTYKPKPDDEPFYKKHAALDYALYDHFSKRLQSQIDSERNSFQEEVQQFIKIKWQMENFCSKTATVQNNEYITIQESKWDATFHVSTEDCRLILKPEIEFTQSIREKQYKVKATWKPLG